MNRTIKEDFNVKKLKVVYSCLSTYSDSVFVASGNFDFIFVDLQYKAPHPDRLPSVSFLIAYRQFKPREDSTHPRRLSASTICGGHLQSAGALKLKRHAIKRQKMSVAGGHTQGLGTWLAEVQAFVLLAVLLRAAGCELTVHAVVRPVAVAALLAFPVCPEGLVGGNLAALVHTAAFAPRHAQAVPHRKAILTLAAFLTGQRARLLRLIQVSAGQRAGGGAFFKMTVLWTRKS